MALKHIAPGFENTSPDPERDGFTVVDVEPASPDDIVMTYLDYKRTGGPPIKVWEHRLGILARLGRLEDIEKRYERSLLGGD
jgi:hypothetical protein